MRKSYTIEQINRIIRMRITGWHPIDIARIEERTQTEISRLLSMEKKARGIQYPKLVKLGTQWTPERIEYEVAKKLCTNGNYKELAASIKMSPPRLSFLMAKRAHMIQQGIWIN